MHDSRVVITGMGVVSPVGLDVPTLWDALCAGRSGIRPISLFDTASLRVRIAGEAHGFDPLNYMSAKDARRCPISTRSSSTWAAGCSRSAGLSGCGTGGG
jgi:3-oxoacyl-[acyl-carrier-protein] synthase II